MSGALESWRLGDRDWHSRLLLGTSRYPSRQTLLDALQASGTELVTVALRRVGVGSEAQNLYSVLRPNPDLHPPGHLDVEGALALADFLLSAATQARIGGFGKNPAGRPLFTPLAAPGSES